MSMKKLSLFFSLILYLVFILLHPYIIRNNLLATSIIFITIIMPSMLPMYIICNLLSNNNLLSKTLYPVFKKLMHFENSTSLSIYLLSFLVGNPTATILINQANLKNAISLNESKRLTCLTFFMNPLFIINTCGKLSFIIIISSFLSSIIIGHLLKNNNFTSNEIINKISFFDIINNTPTILLNIYVLMQVITIIKSPFILLNTPWPISYILDSLDISTGLLNIFNYPLPNFLKFVLLNLLIHSNGLCITFQMSNFSKFISFKELVFKKIVVSIFTTIIALFIYFIFNSNTYNIWYKC